MRPPTLAALFLLAVAPLLSSGARAASSSRSPASVQVALFDQDGSPVREAHLYIYAVDRRHLITGEDVAGSTILSLAPGRYRLYAAYTQQCGDHLDHFSSHEAVVRLRANDTTSLILTLKEAEDGDDYIPPSALKDLQLDPQVAKLFN